MLRVASNRIDFGLSLSVGRWKNVYAYEVEVKIDPVLNDESWKTIFEKPSEAPGDEDHHFECRVHRHLRSDPNRVK